MHDEQPTSHPDANADAATPVGALPDAAPASAPVADFDPEAFEQAAAQLRPSWDDIPEPDFPMSDPPAVLYAPPANRQKPSFHSVTLQGTGEIDVPHQVEVVVPRPPRTPKMDVSRLGHAEDDELSGSPAPMVLPTRSKRGVLIGVAAVVFAATLGFALMRSGSSPAQVERAMAAPNQAEPAPAAEAPKAMPVEPAPVAAPQPVEPAAQVAPQAPVAPEAPPPVVEPNKPAEVAPSPKPQPGTRSSARAEKRSKPARAKESTVERRAVNKTAAGKPKRGAGFVSANPY